MRTIELKLKQKNDFEFQLKNGAKIVEKIQKVSGGWYSCCKIFETIERAVEYTRISTEEMYNAFGGDCVVVIK